MEPQLLIVIGLLLVYMAWQQHLLSRIVVAPRPLPPPKPRRLGWGTLMDAAPTQKLDNPFFKR